MAALDLADVRPLKPGKLGQDLLRPAAGEARTTSKDGLMSREPGRRERPAQFLGESNTDTGGDFFRVTWGPPFCLEKFFSSGPQKSGPGKAQGRFEIPAHRKQSEEQQATPTTTQTALPHCRCDVYSTQPQVMIPHAWG